MWKGDWKNSWRNYSSDTEYARNLLFKQRCSLWKHKKFLSAHDNLWASACLAQAIISLLEETPSRVEGSVIPANSPDSIHTLEFDSYSSSNDTWLFWDCWSSHVCIRWCCSPTYYNVQFILYRTILDIKCIWFFCIVLDRLVEKQLFLKQLLLTKYWQCI